jgi:NCAIR mutase (PurE)-related protein
MLNGPAPVLTMLSSCTASDVEVPVLENTGGAPAVSVELSQSPVDDGPRTAGR